MPAASAQAGRARALETPRLRPAHHAAAKCRSQTPIGFGIAVFAIARDDAR